MGHLKRWKSAIFADGGLFFSVILFALVVFSWSRFIDWDGPIDDLDSKERTRLEGCIAAERSLGDSIYRERPDCRAVLEPARGMASTPIARDCEPRFNDAQGGGDGLDTCGYPGFPKCLDAPPPGCP